MPSTDVDACQEEGSGCVAGFPENRGKEERAPKVINIMPHRNDPTPYHALIFEGQYVWYSIKALLPLPVAEGLT